MGKNNGAFNRNGMEGNLMKKLYLMYTFLLFLPIFAAAQVPQNFLTIGPKTNVNKGIKFNRNSSTPPQIRWLESSSVLQFSNDGSTFFNFPSTAINLSVSTKTGNYTILSTDDVIEADASSGAFTLTLPTPAGNSGKILYLVKIDSTNVVSITGTIDGVTNPSLTVVGQVLQIFSDGGVWRTNNQKSRGVVSKTGNYTLLLSDEIVKVDGSGGAFTITLPSASSAQGRTFILKRTDNTIANAVTISGTIDGASDWKLFTQNESMAIYSDGSEYKLLSHYAETDWVSAGTVTITATTTNPTKGTATIVTDEVRWKRQGNSVRVREIFWKSATGTATSGSGMYLFGMPANITIDTSKLVADTNLYVAATSNPRSNIVGNAYGAGAAGTGYTGQVAVYDSGTVTLNFVEGTTSGSGSVGSVSSSVLPLAGSAVTNYEMDFLVPVSGWKP